MISGLLSQLQNQYRASPMPNMGNLQQAAALQNMTRNQFGIPNYTGLFGMMGNQPSTQVQNQYLSQMNNGVRQKSANIKPSMIGQLGPWGGIGYTTPEQAHWDWWAMRDGG